MSEHSVGDGVSSRCRYDRHAMYCSVRRAWPTDGLGPVASRRARGAVAHRGSLRHFLVCYFSRRVLRTYNPRVLGKHAQIIAHIGDPRQT